MSNKIEHDAIIRIGKDVKSILKDPIDNIHYIHSNRSVDRGYAVVFGTFGTPYFCVPMFFNLQFPSDYPHSPPIMKFLSHVSLNGTRIRLHPNYYVNGKCCLSILNNWTGDKWTGCQTIRSVLMTILMTLTENPLENEPGHSKHSKMNDTYRAIVTDAGLNLLSNYLTKNSNINNNKNYANNLNGVGGSNNWIRFCQDDEENNEINSKFYDYIIENIIKHDHYGKKLYDIIIDNEKYITEWIKPFDNPNGDRHEISCYRMNCLINYSETKSKIVSTLKSIIS